MAVVCSVCVMGETDVASFYSTGGGRRGDGEDSEGDPSLSCLLL